MSATYTKLKSGEWGIRVTEGTVTEGQTVTVTKKSGETKEEVVAKVVWSGNGVTLCAIRASAPGRPAGGRPRSPSYAPRAGGRRRVCLCDDPTNNICPMHG
jgi:hypothetical protein